MFECSTFKSLKYYASIFLLGGGWTRSVVILPDVKGKNIIGSLPIKPAEVWRENRKSRTFAESKFVVFQQQSNAKTLDACS